MELRLTLIEDGFPDLVAAYQFSAEDMAMMKSVARNPIAQAMASEADKRNDPKAHIIRIARLLGANVADFRDDRNGLNGERRREIIERQERFDG